MGLAAGKRWAGGVVKGACSTGGVKGEYSTGGVTEYVPRVG